MLTEAKQLYKLGFAIHWIKKQSKAPVESGWTTGPRKPWQHLKDTYKHGYNVGVRLGTPSKFNDSYLAVIDCDMKSKHPAHLDEMREKLKELYSGSAPIVLSGRGNGSMHVYLRTKKPIAPYRFSQSSEKVKVFMPSVKPSKFEIEKLKKIELKQ